MEFLRRDKSGNLRHIRSAKDLKGKFDSAEEFVLDTMFDEMEKLAETEEDKLKHNKLTKDKILYPVGFRPYNDIWRYEPVDSRYFFTKFIPETPTPLQQECIDVVCGVDPFEFTNLDYEEADLMWGKGSGKDTTVAKCFAYQAYKLASLVNPQKFLGLGIGSPIDIVNVASTGDQAKQVFFKYLTHFIKITTDPDTGYNWFATKNFWWDAGKNDFKYMDLRDKDGQIKQKEIEFGREISCHSLTSERFTGEGLTIVVAVMDEVGAMRPERVFGSKSSESDNKIIGQYRSLGTSIKSRTKYGKLLCISYKYGRNCPMSVLMRKNKTDPKKFVKSYSVYEVRTDKTEKELREQFASDYKNDPEIAKMMYECKDPNIESDRLFSNIFIIKNAIDVKNRYSINPVIGERAIISDISRPIDELLEPWFKGDEDYYYAVHADLAKGQVWKGGDAIGLAMGHVQEIRVNYDKAWIGYYKKQYDIDLSEYEGQLRMGIVMDLMLQIICTPEQRETRIADVRKFIIELQEKRNFSLIKVTLDRWGSQETLQELNHHGIDAELLSVDRTTDAFHTMKDYMQQGIWKCYHNKVWIREAEEVVDQGKKVDHPAISVKRFEDEGVEHGSKDVLDATAAVTKTLTEELINGGEIFFG